MQNKNRHLILASNVREAKRIAYASAGQRILAEVAAPASHPLAPPTLSGTLMTVDLMLQQPTRVTRMIMDLTLQRFIADLVFSSPGGVTGGAVVYDQATMNQLYAARDVERIAPGAEFPLLTGVQLTPKVASVEKWGGKVYITDETRDRNNIALFMRLMRQVANTIVRKINARCIAELNTAISAFSQTFAGNDWQTVITAGTSASTASLYPLHDFARADQLAEQDELGVIFDLVLLNPQEYAQLITIYGATNLSGFLQFVNKDIYVSNRVPAGTAYFVQQQQVGEMRLEKPLGTETWREQETERTWSQTGVRPVMYVTNPFSVMQATGLAG